MIDHAEAVNLRCDNTAGRGDEPVGDDHLLNLLVQDVLHHLKGTDKLQTIHTIQSDIPCRVR